MKRQLLLHFSSNLDQSCYIGSLGHAHQNVFGSEIGHPGALGGALKGVNIVQNKLLLQCDSCERIKAHGPLVQKCVWFEDQAIFR